MGDLLISPLYMLLTCILIFLIQNASIWLIILKKRKDYTFFGGLGYENSFYFDSECPIYTCTN